MKIKQVLLSSLIFITISIIAGLPLRAEYVFLNDGSIVEGSIISDSAQSINIRTADKK